MTSSWPFDQPWLVDVRAGRFEAIPDPLEWRLSLLFAQLPGSPLQYSRLLSTSNPAALYEARFFEAQQTGAWRGTALELWCLLSWSHGRVIAGRDFPRGQELALLDRLVAALRAGLQTITADERDVLMSLLKTGWDGRQREYVSALLLARCHIQQHRANPHLDS